MFIFILIIVVLPFLVGMFPFRWKKHLNSTSIPEIYLMGIVSLFFLAEIVSCAAIKLEWSFTKYGRILSMVYLGYALCSALCSYRLIKVCARDLRAFLKKEKKTEPEKKNWMKVFLSALPLGIVILLQVWGVLQALPALTGDTMPETVLATLKNDAIYAYNPVTGRLLDYGMYPLHKFASLPLFYSFLVKISGMQATTVLYALIPIWVILLGNMVMYIWAKGLFGEKKKEQYMLLFFYNLFVITGDGKNLSHAFHLIHDGIGCETAAQALVVPVLIYLMWQMISKKEWIFGMFGLVLSAGAYLFTKPLFAPELVGVSSLAEKQSWWMLLLALLVLFLARERMGKQWSKLEITILLACLAFGFVSGSSLPILGMSYICVCLWKLASERKKEIWVAVGLSLIICLSGSVLPLWNVVQGTWKVSKEDMAVVAEIDNACNIIWGKEKTVCLLAPERFMELSRLRNGRVTLPYGKDLWHEKCNREIADVYSQEQLLLYEQMKLDYLAPDTVAAMAIDQNCNVLVLREMLSEEAEARYGWVWLANINDYSIYYR